MRGEPTSERTRSGPNLTTTIVMWLLATGLALAYSWNTGWGPTLFGIVGVHGVHLADVIGLVLVWSWAWWAFPLFGRSRRARGSRRRATRG